ncbi:carbohydrate ABC transporter permease [Microbacterium saperdae]|uniref:Carbohydrate ABC transporter membrane protein 2 (CUT1 family) n=1 Tax=Microbacterium saperdae TaxID=69368 RepID=A0A543BB16_9MICO|nr:carbohydrate ABC transporter permease [Microbacterium saperdae]TQL82030.1 carbohydrate ABC transporter membrane protein 2 (CUT1 family) [Microbacterium saperdae]GGM36638.1 sugar ABC transporter permease [Microbacterium saperdae]
MAETATLVAPHSAPGSHGARPAGRRRRRSQWPLHLVLIVCASLMVLPFVWQLLTAFKSVAESRAVPPVLFPEVLDFGAFERFFATVPFGSMLGVSVLSLLLRVAGQLLICTLAAYGFARFRFPGRDALFLLFLVMLMAPSQLFLIAQFDLMKAFGLLNTVPAIAIPGIFSAFGTFLLRQAFLALPSDYEEAARLDGANAFQVFWRVMLPMVGPTVAALAVLTSLYSWNDLLWPLIVTSSPDTMTLPVGLANLQGQYGTDYPTLMAGSFIASLPLVVIFIALQRQFFAGIASSGLKG